MNKRCIISAKMTMLLLLLGLFLTACSVIVEELVPPELEITFLEASPVVLEEESIVAEMEPIPLEVSLEVLEEPKEMLTPLQYALNKAKLRRIQMEKPGEDMLLSLVYGREPIFFDLEPYFPPDGPWRMPALITYYEAMADVEVLFDVLRYVYGAYTYFGGDEVFDPIKASILEEISHFDTLSPTRDLFLILHTHLSQVINDNHFWMQGYSLGIESIFYKNSDIVFDKTNRGFRNRESGLYIEEVIGHDIDYIFRLKADEAGQLFYSPVIYVIHDGYFSYLLDIVLVYEGGIQEEVTLRVPAPTRTHWGTVTDLRYVDDIPIVNLAWMMGMSAIPYGEYARQFLSFAEMLRDEPVVIVDIRSNSGGMSILSIKWLYLLTGEIIHGNYITLVNWDYYMDYHWEPWGDSPDINPFYFSEDDWDELAFLTDDYGNFNNFLVSNMGERRIIERDQILILLVDRHTSSAGEMFADMVFNIKNTLVIGQNTSGTLLTDLAYPELRLPYSGIQLGLGMSVNLYPEGHLPEGIGIRPDIWAVGNALTAALELLKRG